MFASTDFFGMWDDGAVGDRHAVARADLHDAAAKRLATLDPARAFYFQFDPGRSRFLARDGKLSQFQVSAVNRAGSGPVSRTGDIKLEYDPQFNLWQVPTQSVLIRCGWVVVAAAGAVIGVMGGPVGWAVGLGTLSAVGGAIQCMS